MTESIDVNDLDQPRVSRVFTAPKKGWGLFLEKHNGDQVLRYHNFDGVAIRGHISALWVSSIMISNNPHGPGGFSNTM
jgi:hypothetical protein